MEPILIYGYPAGSSMGLVAAFEWLREPYRLCRVDMLGEMRDQSYKRLNPRVETPVLVTDRGDVLTETMAIGAWLEARDTERRITFEAASTDADRMHQLMAFINTGFTAAFSPLWTAMEMADPDPAMQASLTEFGRSQVIERHDRLEEMIGGGKYLVADRPSLADAVLIGVARWLDVHAVANRNRWPKLSALRANLEADAAVQFACELEEGKEPAGSGACKGHVALADILEKYGS